MNNTFSYAPLFSLLDKLQLTPITFAKTCNLAEKTVLKIYSNEPIMISSVCKIAIKLGVELQDIIEINYNSID